MRTGALHSALAWVWLSAEPTFAQRVAEEAQNLAVMLQVCKPELVCTTPNDATGDRGTGIVIEQSGGFLHVLTAGHVVGYSRLADLQMTMRPDKAAGKCSVVTVSAKDSGTDLAVLRCRLAGPLRRRLFFDVLGEPGDLHRGSRLTVVGYVRGPWYVPAVWLLFDDLGKRKLDVFSPLNEDLRGVSGGPLLTDRSEIVGMVYEMTFGRQALHAHPWTYIEEWVHANAPEVRFHTRRVARSAPAVRQGQLELSGGVSIANADNFGWLRPAPSLRISAPLPSLEAILLGFDFRVVENRREGPPLQSVRMSMPAFTVQHPIGKTVGLLRRNAWLGGLSAGGGFAPISVKSMLNGQEGPAVTYSYYLIDAAWRHRFRRSPFGVSVTYREGFSRAAGNDYPRFRLVEVGIFGLYGR